MTDFTLLDGDLALDYNHRLKTTDKVIESVVRRATTIPTGYSKVVRIDETQSIVNPTYGTDLALYLSTPARGYMLAEEIQRAANDDGRVDLYNISYKENYNSIDIALSYSEKTSDSVQQYEISF